MRILAVDTTTAMLTAAICEDSLVLAERSLCQQKAHSQRLMPLLEEMLAECHIELEEIDLFAASVGPGSFTGIRIGLACIKALAQVTQKPVAPISTLEALAYNACADRREIVPLLDGGRGRLFAARYSFDRGRAHCLTQAYATTISEIKTILAGQDVLLAGDGGAMYAETLGLPSLTGRAALPMASSVAAAARFSPVIPAAELNAVYISKPQAQREREEKLNQQTGKDE